MRSIREAVAALAAVACFAAAAPGAYAQSDANLAQDLINPFTTLIRVPMELSYDKRIGPVNGGRSYTLNVQPLIPVALDEDWDLISRTILTLAAQKNVFPGAGSQSGLGDTLQSFFLSPRRHGSARVDWGIGAAMLLPTATDELLGARKWGLGPTAGAYRDAGPWTVGILANHIWSVAGPSGAEAISATFLQPSVSYTRGVWSYTLQTESTYDWKAKQWSLPLQASVAKLTKLGGRDVNLEGGVHYWADGPRTGPKGWGLSFTVTVLVPK